MFPGDASLGVFEVKLRRSGAVDPATLRHALKDVPTGERNSASSPFSGRDSDQGQSD